MLDVRYSHLYFFYKSLNRQQRGLSAIAELLVICPIAIAWWHNGCLYTVHWTAVLSKL